MVSPFSPPPSLTCILCRATISIRKGDKARFFSHISHDHEVHYDMDLFFVVSFLSEAQKETVINIISKKFDRKDKSTNPKDFGEGINAGPTFYFFTVFALLTSILMRFSICQLHKDLSAPVEIWFLLAIPIQGL